MFTGVQGLRKTPTMVVRLIKPEVRFCNRNQFTVFLLIEIPYCIKAASVIFMCFVLIEYIVVGLGNTVTNMQQNCDCKINCKKIKNKLTLIEQ